LASIFLSQASSTRLFHVNMATPVTSESSPIRVSWVSTGLSPVIPGRLGLCFCPGKQLRQLRLRAGHEEQGRPIHRNLDADLKRIHGLGCRSLICLLNEAELRCLGIRKYGESVERAGISFVPYPIVEGAGAVDGGHSIDEVHAVIRDALDVMKAGDNVVMHCRGGVGRAGMMGACLLLLLGEAQSPKIAIELVRQRRCKQAVETTRQEESVSKYFDWLRQRGGSLRLVPAARRLSDSRKPALLQKLSVSQEGLFAKSVADADASTVLLSSGYPESSHVEESSTNCTAEVPRM